MPLAREARSRCRHLGCAADDESSSEDASESSGEEEPSAPREQQVKRQSNFERISPVEETPWAEFAAIACQLMAWLFAFVLVQLCWGLNMRSDLGVSLLPVSFLVTFVAFVVLRGSRHVGFEQVDGLQFMLHWLLQRNECLHKLCLGSPAGPRKSLPDSQSRTASVSQPRRKTGFRYNCALYLCISFGWVLVIGRVVWPCGYLYLVEYSFLRCEFLCKELKGGTSYMETSSATPGPGTGAWISLPGSGNATRAREDLVRKCESGVGENLVLGRVPIMQHHLEWADPHWLVKPRGAWVAGEHIRGHYHYIFHGDPADDMEPTLDCGRFNLNVAVLVIAGLLALFVFSITVLHHTSLAVLTAVTTILSLLFATGILGVWLGWANCRISRLNSHESVFSHLLGSCLFVANYKNGTHYAKSMKEIGRLNIAYESNFRHIYHVSRSEIWFGGVIEGLLLVLVIAAHAGFKHKRMQTYEARYSLMCRRPRLVRLFLKTPSLLDRLPSRDRKMMADTIKRVCKEHQDSFGCTASQVDALLATEVPDIGLEGVWYSFVPAALYSMLRGLIPSLYRQIVVPSQGRYSPAVPEENTLWMLWALFYLITSFVVYLFVLFQIKEACRHYTKTMQVWLIFDTMWQFPSPNALSGDASTEVVEVKSDEEGVELEMLGKRVFVGDFSAEHVAVTDTEGCENGVVNVQAVRDRLPIFWGWREYLIIDYADKRVRLELHLVVAILVLLLSGLLITFDDIKEGMEKPDLRDIESTMDWFEGHVTAMTFQTALDLLFLTPPLLTAINCAATMNRLIESQLHKVVNLADLLDVDAAPGPPSDFSPCIGSPQAREAKDELGTAARNVFRVAKAELSSGGSSATRLLSVIKINRQTFAIASTALSLVTGSQVVEIFDKVMSVN